MKITDLTVITSKDNSRLRRARAVRDGREPGTLFVEGVRLAHELVRSALRPLAIFVLEELSEKHASLVADLARDSETEIHRVSPKIYDSITDTENTQGIVVLAEKPKRQNLKAAAAENSLFVYLNKINNPSNLGAVVRTAEAAGHICVITSPGSTDVYSPKALRASMGSVFRVPIFTDVPLAEAVEIARNNNVRVVAADVGANQSYVEADWRGARMLVLGSEAHGLDAKELSLMDEVVLIPMENGVESLNLAVSAGILLFDAKRQRAEARA